MDWLDKLRESLFGDAVQRSGHLHHGPLMRSTAFAATHHRLLHSGGLAGQLAELNELLDRELRTGDTEGFHLLQDPKATGIQFQRPGHWPNGSLHHLLDLFRDRVLELGYRTQLSDQRISPSGEHRERHYLKPLMAPQVGATIMDQRYGNVLLEAWGQAAGATHLKVLATVYSDRNYSPPLPGMELLSGLLAARGLPLS
jgi:hypothetical protein